MSSLLFFALVHSASDGLVGAGQIESKFRATVTFLSHFRIMLACLLVMRIRPSDGHGPKTNFCGGAGKAALDPGAVPSGGSAGTRASAALSRFGGRRIDFRGCPGMPHRAGRCF